VPTALEVTLFSTGLGLTDTIDRRSQLNPFTLKARAEQLLQAIWSLEPADRLY
jgi:hypothetical protein